MDKGGPRDTSTGTHGLLTDTTRISIAHDAKPYTTLKQRHIQIKKREVKVQFIVFDAFLRTRRIDLSREHVSNDDSFRVGMWGKA